MISGLVIKYVAFISGNIPKLEYDYKYTNIYNVQLLSYTHIYIQVYVLIYQTNLFVRHTPCAIWSKYHRCEYDIKWPAWKNPV